MKLYGIRNNNEFNEYKSQRFKDEHREVAMEAWLEQNSKHIIENGGLLIIGRQVSTNFNTSIDLLGLDHEGNVAVVELKRDKTPRDVLAQALEYASFAATLNSDQLENIYRQYTDDENAFLVESHRSFFALGGEEAVSFNKNQRLVIVGSEIIQPVRQSCIYLRQKGFLVTCLEFSYFQAGSGEQLVSMDVVVGQEPVLVGSVISGNLPKTTEAKFIVACDDAGRAVFAPLLAMAKAEKLPIHWGSRGFSINLAFHDKHIGICFGYPTAGKPNQQAQSFWTNFEYIRKKVVGTDELINEYRQKFERIGLFETGGQNEIKFLIQTKPTPEQVEAIVGLVRDLSRDVKTLANSAEN